MRSDTRIKIFTWHIHGSYLYYLSQCNFEIYIPVDEKKQEGYIGRGTTFSFGKNVIEVPVAQVKELTFDCVLFQTTQNYLKDQYEILSAEQRELPAIYLEHDPPLQVPTDTRHVVHSKRITLVHVTHFNKLMWNNNDTHATVIDHGVIVPPIHYTGELEKGIVVINNLSERGRRLGADIFAEVSKQVPLDLIGMGTEEIGGLGEVLHPQLPQFISRYRFFFSPIRYTSLGLAILEAMTIGVPIVALATTEMATVLRNGESGIIHTNIDYLVRGMNQLLQNRSLAKQLGNAGKRVACEQFNIERFKNDWQRLVQRVVQADRAMSKVYDSELMIEI